MVMVHAKRPKGTVLMFILALIPIANLYVLWRACRVIVEHEEEYPK